MTDGAPLDTGFDELLLSRVRLGVVSALIVHGELPFGQLRALLELTQGNLGAHLKKLQAGEYVTLRKEFVDDKPRTTATLTDRGRDAFHAHLAQLQRIADAGD